MKISEIIREDISAEEQLGGGELLSNLVPVLMFLKNRSEDKDLTPRINTDSLIKLVQNAGDVTFSYESLVDAFESDSAVKELIQSFNEDEVIIKTSDSDGEEHTSSDGVEMGDDAMKEKTVSQMAKRAADKRD